MNPEDRMRRLQQVENWEIGLSARPYAFSRRPALTPLLASLATIAVVAAAGIVLFSIFGIGVRSARPAAPMEVPTSSPSPTPSTTEAATAPAIPWLDSPAVGLVEDVMTLGYVPVCTASSLRFEAADAGSVMGSQRIPITVTNVGSSTCAVTLSHLNATVDGTTSTIKSRDAGGIMVVPPSTKVTAAISFLELCSSKNPPGAPSLVTTPVRVDIGIAGVAARESKVARNYAECGIHGFDTSWNLDERNDNASAATWPAHLAATLDPRIGILLSGPHPVYTIPANASDTFITYSVTLTNNGTERADFSDFCPAFVAAVKVGDKRAATAQSLNCAAVGGIDPGKSARFTMELPMPTGAKGFGTVVWSMRDGTAASSPVVVK